MDRSAAVERRVGSHQNRPGDAEESSDGLTASPTRRFVPRGDPQALLRIRYDYRHRGLCGEQRVEAADRSSRTWRPTWSDRGPRQLRRRNRATRTRPASSLMAVGFGGPTQQPGEPGRRDPEPGGARVELVDMTEGERAQEQLQARRCLRTGEVPTHPRRAAPEDALFGYVGWARCKPKHSARSESSRRGTLNTPKSIGG